MLQAPIRFTAGIDRRTRDLVTDVKKSAPVCFIKARTLQAPQTCSPSSCALESRHRGAAPGLQFVIFFVRERYDVLDGDVAMQPRRISGFLSWCPSIVQLFHGISEGNAWEGAAALAICMFCESQSRQRVSAVNPGLRE
jgi:hypothetical protein